MTDIEYLKKYLDNDKLKDGIKKLKKGIPVQYIIGNINFYGNIINVNKNVLIPRFETELLVEKTIKYINTYFDKKINILDIGTGSGNIAISLKKEIISNVTATDISKNALKVARENAINNKVTINFIESDIFERVKGKFDLIISNPPYIAYDEKIDDIVKNNEPESALFADDNGLIYYKKILSKAKEYINDKAIIAFEIGRTQGDIIKNIALKYFVNAKVSIEKDFLDNDRFVFIFINVRCD